MGGDAAERMLFTTMVRPGDLVPNNTHVDTNRTNIEDRGGIALEVPCADGRDRSLIHSSRGTWISTRSIRRSLRTPDGCRW